MAFTQFAKTQLVKVAGTGEIVNLGQFHPDKNGEIKYVRVLLLKKGTTQNGSSAQLRLHTSSDLTAVYAQSNQFFLTDVDLALGLPDTQDWYSFVRFDFDRNNLNLNLNYYMSLIFPGYVRNADTSYMGTGLDYPFPIYKVTYTYQNYTSYPPAKQVFSYQEPL